MNFLKIKIFKLHVARGHCNMLLLMDSVQRSVSCMTAVVIPILQQDVILALSNNFIIYLSTVTRGVQTIEVPLSYTVCILSPVCVGM